jgi:hypothetical protein
MTKKNDRTKKEEKQALRSQHLRSPEGGFKKATSLEIELEREGQDPDQSPDYDDISDEDDVDDTEEMVDSPENPPAIVAPPRPTVIRKRSRTDDEETQRPLVETILNQAQVITLGDEISESLAESFYNQAMRPSFNMKVGSLINEKALLRCRLKVMARFEELSLKEGADREWPFIEDENGELVAQSLVKVAEQVKIMFGTSDKAETELDLDRQLREVEFQFAYDDDSLEQTAV